MPEEGSTTTVNEVTKTTDGQVKISIEKYDELLEKVADQKGTISDLRSRLHKATNEPPVINRTVVNKTAEMLADERRVWGGTCMGLGASLLVVGAFIYRAGTK